MLACVILGGLRPPRPPGFIFLYAGAFGPRGYCRPSAGRVLLAGLASQAPQASALPVTRERAMSALARGLGQMLSTNGKRSFPFVLSICPSPRGVYIEACLVQKGSGAPRLHQARLDGRRAAGHTNLGGGREREPGSPALPCPQLAAAERGAGGEGAAAAAVKCSPRSKGPKFSCLSLRTQGKAKLFPTLFKMLRILRVIRGFAPYNARIIFGRV